MTVPGTLVMLSGMAGPTINEYMMGKAVLSFIPSFLMYAGTLPHQGRPFALSPPIVGFLLCHE